jgi:hypothetical protein
MHMLRGWKVGKSSLTRFELVKPNGLNESLRHVWQTCNTLTEQLNYIEVSINRTLKLSYLATAFLLHIIIEVNHRWWWRNNISRKLTAELNIISCISPYLYMIALLFISTSILIKVYTKSVICQMIIA